MWHHIVKWDAATQSPQQFLASLLTNSAAAKSKYSSGAKFWAMNETTYAKIAAKIIESNAAGAFVAQINDTMPIVGGKIVLLDFVPDNDIIGGYGDLYLLVERAGTAIAQSEHVQFIEDNTVFKATARYDGTPIMAEGFIVMNIANTAPTTSVSFAPDSANP